MESREFVVEEGLRQGGVLSSLFGFMYRTVLVFAVSCSGGEITISILMDAKFQLCFVKK